MDLPFQPFPQSLPMIGASGEPSDDNNNDDPTGRA
jgi:hypothetical protein